MTTPTLQTLIIARDALVKNRDALHETLAINQASIRKINEKIKKCQTP